MTVLDEVGGLADPVWGVDPSTTNIVVTVIADGRRDTYDANFSAGSDVGDRLAGAEDVALSFLAGLVEAHGVPILVLVEQPFAKGRNVHPISFYFVGIILAACGRVMGGRGIVDQIDPSSWKHAALGDGKGSAPKQDILAWARVNGLDDNCPICGGVATGGRTSCKTRSLAHDKADSFAIAVAAARRWRSYGRSG